MHLARDMALAALMLGTTPNNCFQLMAAASARGLSQLEASARAFALTHFEQALESDATGLRALPATQLVSLLADDGLQVKHHRDLRAYPFKSVQHVDDTDGLAFLHLRPHAGVERGHRVHRPTHVDARAHQGRHGRSAQRQPGLPQPGQPQRAVRQVGPAEPPGAGGLGRAPRGAPKDCTLAGPFGAQTTGAGP